MLGLDPDEKLKLDEQVSIVLKSTLTLPKTIIELPIKSLVASGLNDPSIIRNTTRLDFKDKNLNIVRFAKINNLPAVREHRTPKFYVDEALSYWVDESSLLRLDLDQKIKLDEQNSIKKAVEIHEI